jgi:hypothetical protein
VVIVLPPLGGSLKKQAALCLRTYAPAGTLIVLASESPLARAMAPRRLQSPGVASSQADSEPSSVVVSTFRTAARAGTAPANPTARQTRTSRNTLKAFIDPLPGGEAVMSINGCDGALAA